MLPRRRERRQLFEPHPGQYMREPNRMLAQLPWRTHSQNVSVTILNQRRTSLRSFYRFFLIASRQPSIFSIEVENEKRR
jgi:hypothetical protein